MDAVTGAVEESGKGGNALTQQGYVAITIAEGP